MTIALMELKVKVRGQVRVKVWVSVRNAVGGTSVLNRGHFSSIVATHQKFIKGQLHGCPGNNARSRALLQRDRATPFVGRNFVSCCTNIRTLDPLLVSWHTPLK